MRLVFLHITLFLKISLFLTLYSAFAQKKSETDSLLQLLSQNTKQDTLRVRILSQLCWKNRNNDFVVAIGFGKQGYELAKELKDYKGQSEVLNFMGVVYRNMGDYVEATARFFEALRISEQNKIIQQIAYSNNNIGDILKAQKKFKDALPYSQKALEMFEALRDERGMGYALVRLGEIYQSLKDFDKAIEAFQKSLTIRLKLNDKSTLITSYNRVGTIYSLKKQYKQALEYYQKGLELSEQLQDKRATAGCLDNIAWVYIRLNDFKTAQSYSMKSLNIAKAIKAKVDEKNAYLTLSKLYESQSQFIISYDFFKKYVSLNDSIDNIEKANQLSKMQAVYDTKKKEQENNLLRKENELKAREASQTFIILLSVSAALLLTLFLIFFIYRSRQKQIRLNNLLSQQKEEIASQRDAVMQLNQAIELKNEEIGRKKLKLENNIHILSELSKSEAVANGDWQLLVKDITSSVAKALEISGCQLWYHNFKEDNFYCLSDYQLHAPQKDALAVLPLPQVPIFGEVIRLNQQWSFENEAEMSTLDDASKIFFNTQKAAAAILFPLWMSEQQKGMMVCTHEAPKTWELEDLTFLNSMADEMTITYQNFRKKQSQIRIQKQNEEITSSINYARRIQAAFLPLEEDIEKVLQEFFILYQPRDIVSGDFYWFEQVNQKIILAAADCTGHGVPGALMSMIGNEILNEIVIQRNIIEVDKILNYLHKGIRKALRQDISKNSDGMDIALVSIDLEKKQMEFAGAKNPLIYIQDNQLQSIKADIFSIGGVQLGRERIFTKHSIDISTPTTFYMFSDGFQDQFGGAKNKKFMIKNLKEILLNIQHNPMSEQKNILRQALANWMQAGKTKQTDDILLMGVRIW